MWLSVLKMMTLECQKYNERMEAETAYCRHPNEYCKFRTSCMIQFVSKENKKKAGVDTNG